MTTNDRYREMAERSPRLTTIDLETLRFLADGLSNKEMASMIQRSVDTVRHRNLRLYARLGVSSRSAAVAAGYERGLLAPVSDEDRSIQAMLLVTRNLALELEAKVVALESKVAFLMGRLAREEKA